MFRQIARNLRTAWANAGMRRYLVENPTAALTRGPLLWDHFGVAARTSAAWRSTFMFEAAYEQTWDELEELNLSWHKRPDLVTPLKRENFRNEWNVHVAVWAAKVGMKLEGDFVECGVGAGIFSRHIMCELAFDRSDRTFWLADRWAPGPGNFINDFETAKKLFWPYKRARLIQGEVPGTLDQITAEKVAYLYIDMNAAEPEIAAAEYFWPRMSKGAMMVLDDFGFPGHEAQNEAFVRFAEQKRAPLLFCPTGQGIIVKP